MNYPDKNWVIDTLLAVSKRAAEDSSSSHPEDIGIAMTTAIEIGAQTIDVLWKAGRL